MENPNKIKLKIDVIITYLILLMIASLAYFLSTYVVKNAKFNENQISTPAPLIELPSTYPDYDAIKGKNSDQNIKSIKFTDDCGDNGCINDKPATKDFDGIKKNYSVKGSISRGYLYIEAAVDYTRPLTNYDDFYFTLNYFGGHLVTGELLLPVPASNISRYLFDLRKVSYWGRGIKNINFLSIIQSTKTFNIHTSVSSDRPGRVLKEVAIYYQCAENSDCSIEEIQN